MAMLRNLALAVLFATVWASTIVLGWAAGYAMLASDGSVVIRFNELNEGYAELILLAVVAVVFPVVCIKWAMREGRAR